MKPSPRSEILENWKKTSYSFCPKCGGALAHRSIRPSEPDRLVCNVCGFVFYLDPKVAVATIVPVEGKILLLRRAIEPAYGKWVFPSGFVDLGEQTEVAAIRETREECHLEVRIRRLLNIYSYPDHPVIVIVYVGEATGGQPTAGDETLEAALFSPEEIPWNHLAFESTAQALREYLAKD